MLRSNSACSSFLTIFTSSTPSAIQIRLSIWPRLDAAAVWTSAVCPSRRMVSNIASAVNGLIKLDAPSLALCSGSSGKHMLAFTQRYSAYIPPPITATVLSIKLVASSPSPTATTVPAPSLPTGSDWSIRAFMICIPCGDTGAVNTLSLPEPDELASVMVDQPNITPRSEGLMGVASIFITTSSGPGVGMSTSVSARRSSPVLLTVDSICR